jgi:hypothetical protein
MVVSMSMAGYCGSLCSTDAMVLAVETLSANDITVVVAAGNSADDACLYTPGAAPSAVTVGATDVDDAFAYYSSYGSCVDILAPGTLVNSACASSSSPSCSTGDQYVEYSGTSMACPHVSGVIALWLAQSSDNPTPSPDVVKDALQCTSAQNKVTGVPAATLNMLLQLPNASTSVGDVVCDHDVCDVTDTSSGEVCSGQGQCLYGVCICEDDYIGENCEYYSPEWLFYSWCCNGGDLSDRYNPPFNTISFLWTDLNPSSNGNIYYGSVDDDTFAIVFDDVSSYSSGSCRTVLELVLYRNSDIKLVYMDNDIGFDPSCYSRDVSVGLKAAHGDNFEFMQIYGPSKTGMPDNTTLMFTKTSSPTSVPSVSYSPTDTPTGAPSGTPTVSMVPTLIPSSNPSMGPIVRPSGSPSSIPSNAPSSVPTLTYRPSLHPTVRYDTYRASEKAYTGSYFEGQGYSQLSSQYLADDEVIALPLPFTFHFFRNTFNYAYLSSNGLVSFGSAPQTSTTNIQQQDPTSKVHKKGHVRQDTDIYIDRSPLKTDENTVYIIVLHPHVSVSRTHTMASTIRSRHIDEDAVMFEATVLSVQPHLRMLSVQGVSKAALSYLSGHADVNVVQKSVEVKAVGFVEAAYSTDTYSWGLDRIDQVNLPLDNASYLPAGPGVNDGSGVSVYVLDTGIDTTHIAFSGRNVTNIFDAYSNDGSVSDNNDVNG